MNFVRGDKDELENVSLTPSPSDFRYHLGGDGRNRRQSWRAWDVGIASLTKVVRWFSDFIYRTYQGAGIIFWLLVIAFSPLPFLYLLLTVPFPYNTVIMMFAVVGYAFTRGRYTSSK